MKEYNIPFNKPYLTGKEMHYMYQAVYSGKISGNGIFTQNVRNISKETTVSKRLCLPHPALMRLK